MYDKKQIESSINSPNSIWNVINKKIGNNRKKIITLIIQLIAIRKYLTL